LAVELGGARRQRQERDVGRNPEVLGTVPSGLIEDQNGVVTTSCPTRRVITWAEALTGSADLRRRWRGTTTSVRFRAAPGDTHQ
jgi:hypothetical protein